MNYIDLWNKTALRTKGNALWRAVLKHSLIAMLFTGIVFKAL